MIAKDVKDFRLRKISRVEPIENATPPETQEVDMKLNRYNMSKAFVLRKFLQKWHIKTQVVRKEKERECLIQDMNTTTPDLTVSASLIQNMFSRTSVRILRHDSVAPNAAHDWPARSKAGTSSYFNWNGKIKSVGYLRVGGNDWSLRQGPRKSASLAQGYTGHGRYAITASKVLMQSISFHRWTALPFVYWIFAFFIVCCIW